ncbi:MAG: hypothetical protein AAF711_11375 [Planctomycetota bacterium]
MTVIEQLGTFTATQERVERGYVIDGETTETAALAALLATAPNTVTVGGYAIPRRDDECRVDETEVLNVWEGTAVYAFGGGSVETDGVSLSFEVSGQNVHLNTGIRGAYGSYVKESDPSIEAHEGLIGIVPPNTVEGVDVQVPQAAFTLSWTIPASQFTQAYEKSIAQLVGKVNSNAFRGYDPGELLISRLGANQEDVREDVRMSATFSVSENVTDDINLGNNVIIAGGKDGWDYLWVTYTDFVDAQGGLIVPKPLGAAVSRVYHRANYSALGAPS